jgi:3-hydroxybutyryl-CoA dehydratase
MNKGDKFEVPFSVTAAIHTGFIQLFGDKNPLHVDGDFAKSKGFSSEVMHGNILGGFLSYFIGECLPVKNVIIHSQEIKYSKPVYKSDNLVLKAEIVDVFPSVNVVEFRFRFENKETAIAIAKGKIQIGII